MKSYIFVISAPSGTGKTSIVEALLEQEPSLGRAITHTTRVPREGEIHGIDYYFVDRSSFKKGVEQEIFLEWTQTYEHYYGTSKQSIDYLLKSGKHVLLVIDVVGADNIRKLFLENVVYIFIEPPSFETLKERLITRNRNDTEEIEKRLELYDKEMQHKSDFDYIILNDRFDEAVKSVGKIIQKISLLNDSNPPN